MKTILTIIFSFIFLSAAVFADEIVVGSDIWPPLVDNPASDKPGYVIEAAQKIFKKNGHTLVYKTLPWARAINLARKGIINGIASTFVGDAPDFVFPENAIGLIENHAWVRKDSNWKYEGIESLKKVRLGLIIDYDYGPEMAKFIKDKKNSKNIFMNGGNNPLKINIIRLKTNQLQALIEAKPVFTHTVQKMGLTELFKPVGLVGDPYPVYVAFSPGHPKSKEYARILSDGITQLRQSGELAKIMAKYGQKDWE